MTFLATTIIIISTLQVLTFLGMNIYFFILDK